MRFLIGCLQVVTGSADAVGAIPVEPADRTLKRISRCWPFTVVWIPYLSVRAGAYEHSIPVASDFSTLTVPSALVNRRTTMSEL